jgi:hypothetical protein
MPQVLRPSEGAQESSGGEVMNAVKDFLGYAIFVACIYIVLVVGGAS